MDHKLTKNKVKPVREVESATWIACQQATT